MRDTDLPTIGFFGKRVDPCPHPASLRLMSKRCIDIRALLADATRRRVLMACQAREGIDTTMAQALAAYDKEHAP